MSRPSRIEDSMMPVHYTPLQMEAIVGAGTTSTPGSIIEGESIYNKKREIGAIKYGSTGNFFFEVASGRYDNSLFEVVTEGSVVYELQISVNGINYQAMPTAVAGTVSGGSTSSVATEIVQFETMNSGTHYKLIVSANTNDYYINLLK